MARRPRKDRSHQSPPRADAFRPALGAVPRPRFELAGEAGRAGILDRALRLLDEHGVAVIHEDAHAALVKAGAKPGREAARLRLLRAMVEEALDATPKSALLAGKTEARDVTLPRGDNGFIMRTGTGAHGFIEIDSRDFRNMEISDVETIARVAIEHDLTVLTDEVYEYLTFDDAEHIPLATLPGMRERTLTLSSTGKTFSLTGWKIGWATGPADLVSAAQAAHQFLTFAVATPLQVAMSHALDACDDAFLSTYRREYAERRDFLVDALREAGFTVAVPRGTYFVLADFTRLFDGDDRAFARHLIETCGVAAIPPSVFFEAQPDVGKRLIRFAFCKRMETLQKAADRLRRL